MVGTERDLVDEALGQHGRDISSVTRQHPGLLILLQSELGMGHRMSQA